MIVYNLVLMLFLLLYKQVMCQINNERVKHQAQKPF